MPSSTEIAAQLPYLRRFARAMTGGQKSGDSYVIATLEALAADPSMLPEGHNVRVPLYRNFLKILNSIDVNGKATSEPDQEDTVVRAADRNLAAITPRARQAFLLISVEDFTIEEAATALDTSEEEIKTLIDQAGREIAQQVATDVLIIEDEPLIAMDLETIVEGLGHRVSRVVRTHKQAVAAAQAHRPGLVLADIQLADGSSGLEATNEILELFQVPIVFVTAYPERLLTGERPEPTFLITKPFRTETLKAVISQALFFDMKAGADDAKRSTG